MMDGQLLTPQDVAGLLGVSVQTLAIWRCEKRYSLSYVKVGNRVRYRRAEVERFIEARTCASEPSDAGMPS